MAIKDNISFFIQGSLINRAGQTAIPDFFRSSPVWAESITSGSIHLHPVPSHYPLIFEDGSWMLQPIGVNLINNNLSLETPLWQRGSNVTVSPDNKLTPSSSYTGRKVQWSNGIGSSQKILRTFSLKQGTRYCYSILALLPHSQQAGNKDVISIKDGVSAPYSSIGLYQLNDYPDRYQFLQATFTTSGNNGVVPDPTGHVVSYPVTAIGTDSFTVTVSTDITASQSKGCLVRFGNAVGSAGIVCLPAPGSPTQASLDATQTYLVLDNSASSNNSMIVKIDPTDLANSGLTVGDFAIFMGAPSQTITIEFYVESALTISFAGMQLEERDFRTSMIFQDNNLAIRAGDQLSYGTSPIAGLSNFGIFISIRQWLGDGSLFSLGNLSVSILKDQLLVQINDSKFTIGEVLDPTFDLFLQTSNTNGIFSIFLNGTLKFQENLGVFIGSAGNTELVFTSVGLRRINQFFVLDNSLLDGGVMLGDVAASEVQELFNTKDLLINATEIASTASSIVLPEVIVPPRNPPLVSSTIVNIVAGVIVLNRATGFSPGMTIFIVRGDTIIFQRSILDIKVNDVVLNSVEGLSVGDKVFFGGGEPGYSFVRMPFEPIDPQVILNVDRTNKTINIYSTLGFLPSRAFVVTKSFQEISEIIISSIDNVNNLLKVNDTAGIMQGHIIAQPLNEMMISPYLYSGALLDPNDGVEIGEKYKNGVRIFNNTSKAQLAQAILTVHI